MKLPLKDIKPNPDNPRIIKDDNFKKLVTSLKDFPEMADVREIVVNKDHVILGGNMRFKAMQEAGWTEAPVKVVDWSEDKQREFIIKDNVSGGEWDWDSLANEWDMDLLDAWGLDVSAYKEDDEVEEDEAPEVSSEPPVSQLGSIYQLGRHRVMCGDSTDKDTVALLMGGVQADMVFTDPPYNADYSGRGQNNLGKIKNDDMSDDDFEVFIDGFLPNLIASTKHGGSYYICCNWKDSYPRFYFACNNNGLNISANIVWNKGSGGMGWQDYRFQYEFIIYAFTGGHQWYGGRTETDIWDFNRDNRGSYDHPTQKPVMLSAKAITNSSKSGEMILDLFLGSGSTLIACEQTDRTCYGMELDPKYVDVIRKRYAKYVNNNELPDNWEELTPAIKTGEKQVENAIS